MSFYCKGTGDGSDFSIDRWNEEFKANNLIGEETSTEIHCTEQCFECMADVGDRRKRTQELINKNEL